MNSMSGLLANETVGTGNEAQVNCSDQDPGQCVAEFLESTVRKLEAERAADSTRDSDSKSAQKRHDTIRNQILAEHQDKETEERNRYQENVAGLQRSLDEELARRTELRDSEIRKIENRLSDMIMKESKKRDESHWHSATNADSETGALDSRHLHMQRRLKQLDNRLLELRSKWKNDGITWEDDPEIELGTVISEMILIGEVPPQPDPESLEKMVQDLESTDSRLKSAWSHKLLSWKAIPVATALAAGLCYAAELPWIPPLVIVPVLGITGVLLEQRHFYRKLIQAADRWHDLYSSLAQLRARTERWYEETRKSISKKLEETRDAAAIIAKQNIFNEQEVAAGKVSEARAAHAEVVSQLQEKANSNFASLEEEHKTALAAVQNDADRKVERIREELETRKLTIEQQYRTEIDAIRSRWEEASRRTASVMESWKRWRTQHARSWSQITEPAARHEPAGSLLLGQESIALEDAIPAFRIDSVDRSALPDLSDIPIVLPLPGPKSTIWIQSPPGRRSASNLLLQTIALRILASFPPGQAKFTLIDPVGLGQTFSGLLHLADYEPSLVNQRPWSESRDIEIRLAELTMHLEFVVQNYLRNQYETIEAYNRDAGEVAEPYRFLIIADWPAGMTDESVRRIRRLIEAGGRCGIYVLIGHDLSQPGPIDPSASDIRGKIERIVWSADRNRWSWPAHPLDSRGILWESLPEPGVMTNLVREIGAAAKKSMRVEVPFSVVAPQGERIWTESTAHGIEIPLGRAGARQLQSLKLGEGTSQHMLLAGRTGSGKSTLLHAIATNAALRYSPTELELYLVDFKKGVEFKNYATRDLPQAQVVGVESEREFGLSVLERLDRELTIRGDLFRKAGVQDVAGFRIARPGEPLPRILLIVDEFQELFNEDDRIASDSATLLDRLVRQGRAFGLHVILGSQSMAGAYAIARSTIGQMGVRIALQCNENDSRLILSEDNPAARMLSRPGEAIYNDANGLPEGNHLFQAVWISDHDREVHLGRIHSVAVAQNWRRKRPMVVFEGNAAGDIRKNATITKALTGIRSGTGLRAFDTPEFWPGETVTISDPPAIRFDRQPASNVLIVGRQSVEIRAMLASAVLGIVLTAPEAEIHIVESPVAGETGMKPQWEGISPHVRFIEPIGLKEELSRLRDTLHQRQDDPSLSAKPVFLIVNDLARLRDLRKSDDDYGFGGFGSSERETPSPTKVLAELLRDGPAVGIHTILWTDGSISLGHSTDRSALNEFGTIVIYQTTAAESTHFLDHVAASRLDRTQALLVRPSENESFKIRPYAQVEPELWREWSDAIRCRVGGRSQPE
jgi:energy-coupling factor transporter ATP-binding protein EcfA2